MRQFDLLMDLRRWIDFYQLDCMYDGLNNRWAFVTTVFIYILKIVYI